MKRLYPLKPIRLDVEMKIANKFSKTSTRVNPHMQMCGLTGMGMHLVAPPL